MLQVCRDRDKEARGFAVDGWVRTSQATWGAEGSVGAVVLSSVLTQSHTSRNKEKKQEILK